MAGRTLRHTLAIFYGLCAGLAAGLVAASVLVLWLIFDLPTWYQVLALVIGGLVGLLVGFAVYESERPRKPRAPIVLE